MRFSTRSPNADISVTKIWSQSQKFSPWTSQSQRFVPLDDYHQCTHLASLMCSWEQNKTGLFLTPSCRKDLGSLSVAVSSWRVARSSAWLSIAPVTRLKLSTKAEEPRSVKHSLALFKQFRNMSLSSGLPNVTSREKLTRFRPDAILLSWSTCLLMRYCIGWMRMQCVCYFVSWYVIRIHRNATHGILSHNYQHPPKSSIFKTIPVCHVFGLATSLLYRTSSFN